MAEFGEPTITTRAYFSMYHLWGAKHFVQRVREIEENHEGRSRFDWEHRACVMNAIFSSVAFMEAAINEVFQDVADKYQNYVSPLDSDTQEVMASIWEPGERFSILAKYQFALLLARQNVFLRGENPFQNANLVIELRNELMHYKPESLGGSLIHDLEPKLKNKFASNRLMDGSGNPFFPDKCLGHGCAEWAMNSCKDLANTFFSRVGITPPYERLKL